MHDIENQKTDATCELPGGNVSTNLIINLTKPPFDNPDLRRAMALSLDRKSFIDILDRGHRPRWRRRWSRRPSGIWGMPKEMLEQLPGYGPDIAKNRAEARAIMQKLGYGPDKRLAVTIVDARHPALSRPGGDPHRPAQGDLYRRRAPADRHDAMVPDDDAQGLHGRAQPDRHLCRRPRRLFYENYACGGVGNYNGYCNPEIDKLIDQQSMEPNAEKRKHLVWEIERRLTEDGAKPLVYFNKGATCWQPYVKNETVMENSIYNGWRMEICGSTAELRPLDLLDDRPEFLKHARAARPLGVSGWPRVGVVALAGTHASAA